jgi:hypothetical protein
MKKYFISLILIIVGFSIPVNAQEVSVFLDKENKIDVMGKESARVLQLFPEYQDIVEIRLYMSPDSTYFLEIIHNVDQKRQKVRQQLSQTEVSELREKVTNAVYTKDATMYKNVEGKSYLLWSTAFLSLAWSGVLQGVLQIDNGNAAAGTFFLTAGAGFLIPYMLTSKSDITLGMANFAVSGGVLGLGHGAMLALVIGGEDYTEQGLWGSILVTSVAEYIANYNIARVNNFSGGKASVISGYSLCGSILGIYTSGIFDLFDEDNSPSTYAATILLGTGLGYGVGALVSNTQNFTEGDASIMFNSAILSTAIPVSLWAMTQSEDYKLFLSLMAVSGAAGLWLGSDLVRGYDFSNSHGTYNTLAMIGGGMVGAGIGLITSSAINENKTENAYRIIPLLATIGATAGFMITYNSFKIGSKVTPGTSGLNLEFNPTALALGNLIKTKEPMNIPFLSLRYRF